MKTYFNYNQVIASKDICEAISMVHGASPIIGFGSGTIDQITGKLKVKPLPDESDPIYSQMKGRLKQWNIYKGANSPEADQTNFAGITRDGYIFGSDEEQFDVVIQGSKGTYNEVLLFAYHTPVTEPVENPVTFLAFWSESSESFYELYKKSLDPYYPVKVADRSISFENHAGTDTNLNYEALITKVTAACTYYQNNSNSLVLMGIYGTGTNSVTGESGEKFALVPYNGDFPDHMNYTPGIHSSLKQSISRIEKILGVNSSQSEVGTTSISELLNQMKAEILAEVGEQIALAILPTGSIILWQGDTIPEGWAEFTDAAGRVVVGFQTGGIKVPSGITGTGETSVLTAVGAIYNPPGGDYNNPLVNEYLPRHRHGVGVGQGGQDNSSDDNKSTLQNWDNRTSNLNGNVGDRGATLNVVNGGVNSSWNFQGTSQGEQSVSQWNAIKLPKAIALRYIIKIS